MPLSRPFLLAAAFATATLTANAAPSTPDQRFVEHAAHGGMAEVSLSQVAQDKATDPKVKDFAMHMVKDHTQAGDELKQVATARGYKVPASLDADGRQAKDKLAAVSGATFDKAYMTRMLADHKKTVDLFEDESRHGKDADIKAFAEKTLPTLKQHLKMAQDTATAVKVTGE